MSDPAPSGANPTPPSATMPSATMPSAVVRTVRSAWNLGYLWLIPFAALVAVGWLVYREWALSGVIVSVRLPEGHGIKPGDAVRYRGITVGAVRSVVLTDQSRGVLVRAEFNREAVDLATEGSQFWVVRAQLDWTGLRGSETIIGANYLAVQPPTTSGKPQYEFVGLEEPPLAEANERGGLQIVLQAKKRGGLRPGVPVFYRQVRIGTIVSVGLASDASAVEARAVIRSSFVNLVRENSKFWNVSGLRMEGSFTGLKLELDSAESLFAGGVALATPNTPGRVAPADQRFELFETADPKWLDYRPSIPLGDPRIRDGLVVPRPLRVQLAYKRKGVLRNDRSTKQGWALLIGDRVVGPRDVLVPPADALEPELEIAGKALPPPGLEPGSTDLIAKVRFPISEPPFPARLVKPATVAQDVSLIGDPNLNARAVSAAWMTQTEAGWAIDAAVSLGAAWHGAVALAADGTVVGMVIVPEKGPALLAPVEP